MSRPSVPEMAAAHVREGLRMGRWGGALPGAARLAKELDVAPATIRSALRLLEAEGLLAGRGLGRRRGIVASAVGALAPPLRVGILRHDARATDDPQSAAVLTEILHSLGAGGHAAFFIKKSHSHPTGRARGRPGLDISWPSTRFRLMADATFSGVGRFPPL